MIGYSEISIRNDQWERLRELLYVPHEHCEGRNECDICDKPLIEDAVDVLERLQEEISSIKYKYGYLEAEKIVIEEENNKLKQAIRDVKAVYKIQKVPALLEHRLADLVEMVE